MCVCACVGLGRLTTDGSAVGFSLPCCVSDCVTTGVVRPDVRLPAPSHVSGGGLVSLLAGCSVSCGDRGRVIWRRAWLLGESPRGGVLLHCCVAACCVCSGLSFWCSSSCDFTDVVVS